MADMVVLERGERLDAAVMVLATTLVTPPLRAAVARVAHDEAPVPRGAVSAD